MRGFRYGNVVHISHTDSLLDGEKFRVVNREHLRGFSQTKLVWKYSPRKGKVCWCTVYNVESSKPIRAEE